MKRDVKDMFPSTHASHERGEKGKEHSSEKWREHNRTAPKEKEEGGDVLEKPDMEV